MNAQIERAMARSAELLSRPWRPTASKVVPTRRFVMGDPQSSTAKLFSVLDQHELLGDDGMLKPEVGLVSVGDHFDYGGPLEEVRLEGLKFLRWLAEHPREQVQILIGNHDICRVAELAPFSDATYAQAQAEARAILEAKRLGNTDQVDALTQAFHARYPTLPTPASTLKDFFGFCVVQRELVQTLLLGQRMDLALSGVTQDGHEALLTHAALTLREVALLGLEPAHTSAQDYAEALQAYVAQALEVVREDWTQGAGHAPLSLAPLHEMGFAGQEGGGLLYHRPIHGARLAASEATASAIDRAMPRRFDPRTLPQGLVQVCGHTGHAKCLESLDDWVCESARERPIGGLRTLHASPEGASYQAGIVPPHPQAATLYLVDVEMNKPQESYPLFPMEMVRVGALR